MTDQTGNDGGEPEGQDASPAAVDATASVTSPVSGVSEAITAGASFLLTATNWRARKLRRGVRIELPAYLGVQCSWFMAFGLQLVLFPYLITGRGHLHPHTFTAGCRHVVHVYFMIVAAYCFHPAPFCRSVYSVTLLRSPCRVLWQGRYRH